MHNALTAIAQHPTDGQEDSMKAIKVTTNKRGIQYALVQDGDTFGVYKLCENYSSHVKGGIAKAWRYVQKGMTFDAATNLFDKRGA
jgi:hypothetical protein